MYGDFSQRQRAPDPNIAGVLYQQGRVMFDTDGNAQTQIAGAWQDTAGKDAFGAHVAAVPAEAPASFRLDAVAPLGGGVYQVQLQPGRCWADGLLVRLEGAPAPLARHARYLAPPVAPAPAGPVAGNRDAVVLDVWRESLSAFHAPQDLIEPALGGPDTTGRVMTAFAIRLLRLAAGDTCGNIAGKLVDNVAAKGRLSVTLQPVVPMAGDCPVVDSGGYTGFEHSLFRIEVAENATHFKWSQFNGGLVGRATFRAGGVADITANLQAIVTSGLTEFFLEARAFDANLGHWVTTYGGTVTLDNANRLVLPAAPTYGAPPAVGADVFVRLWNGLRPIADFAGAAQPLVHGIRLRCDAIAAGRYTPGDFWTFTVRADGVPNALVPMPAGSPPTLIDNQPPEGVRHHRVPLGVVTWAAGPAVAALEDCRHVFQPLTRLKGCCTYRVGDGMTSFGDFSSIQQAVDALPDEGGEICLLPGVYRQRVDIVDRKNIRIHGCGPRSRIVGPAAGAGGPLPAIHIEDSRGIALEDFAVEATGPSIGIRMLGVAFDGQLPAQVPMLRDIRLAGLRIAAGEESAIDARGVRFLQVHGCDVRMRDRAGQPAAIFVRGDDIELEHNAVGVRSDRQLDDGSTVPLDATVGRGGIQVGGTSERVRIIDNLIEGGSGNGITLGSVNVSVNGAPEEESGGWVFTAIDPCDPRKPGGSEVPDPDDDPNVRVTSAGALYDIRIERNRIFAMGMNGIGVAGFFDLSKVDEIVSVVRLSIVGNEIRRCLFRGVGKIAPARREWIGYGAIQLAEAIDAVIRENTLEGNGRSALDPTCGIYALHAEGIDISANHILGNGPRGDDDMADAEEGARAGIFIAFATTPLLLEHDLAATARLPIASGLPSLKVHDNVVSQPLGPALHAVAHGTVSVQDNQLTSLGSPRRSARTRTGFVGAAVQILDLGESPEDLDEDDRKGGGAMAPTGRVQPAVAIDVRRRPRVGGNVLFVDNQVLLEMRDTESDLAWTSIFILTRADLGFEDNQCDCNLLRDFVLANAGLLAGSLRMVGNRFREGRVNAAFSAVAYGVPMNTVSANQASHCIYADSSQPVPFLMFDDNNLFRWLPFGAGQWGGTKEDNCRKYLGRP